MGAGALAKRLFWRSPYPFRIAVQYAQYLLQERRWTRREIAHHGLPLIQWEPLLQVKRSDTVFLLGSGWSINEIPPARWDVIRRHDSIGFNFWLYHQLVPNLYLYEMTLDYDTDVAQRLADIAHRRAPEYRDTVKIVSQFRNGRTLFDFVGGEFRRDSYAHLSVPAYIDSDRQLDLSLTLLRGCGVFRPRGGKAYNVFKHAGSATAAISLAIKMGYRRIVLCGVDLTSPRYYYQDPERYPEAGDLHSSIRTPKHESVMPGLYRNAYPVDRIVPAMKRLVLDPLGIEIYVESTTSALHPGIPLAPDAVWET